MDTEKKEKINNFIKGNMINFIVVLTSLIYIAWGLFDLQVVDTSEKIKIATRGGVGIIVGLMIKSGVGENGFNKGYASSLWTTNYEKYNNACNLANPYIERVDNFYQCEIIEKKKQYRRTLLSEYRMKYEWFFDDMGDYIENNERLLKLDKKQQRVLNKCIKVKIYNLNLFSEYGNEIEADTKKEKTDKDQRVRMLGKNSLSQVLTAILGAYFTITLVDGIKWENVLMTTIQVCLWVFCGVLQLYTNYNYIVIEKVNKLKRKIELIVKFTKGCEKGNYLIDPYEKEQTKEETENENEHN